MGFHLKEIITILALSFGFQYLYVQGLVTRLARSDPLVLADATGQPTPTTASSSTGLPRQATVYSQCIVPGTVGVTFDDGPSNNTKLIMDQFDAIGAKVTFFVNGYNYDCIYDFASVLQTAYQNGHQIGSHTWSHPHMPTLTDDAALTEITKNEDAIQAILGRIPTYFRFPFGEYNDSHIAVLNSRGYKVVAMWNLDSGDSSGFTVDQSKQIYDTANGTDFYLALNHDPDVITAVTMVPYIINWARQKNLKIVTVGECLGDPPTEWYKTTTNTFGAGPYPACV